MPSVSYITIYGPPVYDAIKALEKIAVDMPEVCIMDTIIDTAPLSAYDNHEYTSNYFNSIPVEIKVERCNNIISKSGEKLGDYDFYFEWFTKRARARRVEHAQTHPWQ